MRTNSATLNLIAIATGGGESGAESDDDGADDKPVH